MACLSRIPLHVQSLQKIGGLFYSFLFKKVMFSSCHNNNTSLICSKKRNSVVEILKMQTIMDGSVLMTNFTHLKNILYKNNKITGNGHILVCQEMVHDHLLT